MTGDHNSSGLSTTLTLANWHPLTWLSLQLDASLFGPEPAMFHRTNLLLHLANVLLLATVLRQMTGYLWRSFVVAALFAVHPLHVESVAWIKRSARDVLSTLISPCWALLAYTHLRTPAWLESHDTGRSGHDGQPAQQADASHPAVPAAPAGLLAAATTGARPADLHCRPAGDVVRPGHALRFGDGEAAALFPPVRRLLRDDGDCSTAGGSMVGLEDAPLRMRLANAIDATVCYVEQIFYPLHLAVFYPHPKTGLPWSRVSTEALLLLAITAAVCWAIRSRPYLAVGWLWFLGTLVPVIGLVQVGNQARADRYTYVPLIGLFVLLVWGACDLFGPRRKTVLAALAAAVLVACVFLTRSQVCYWANTRGALETYRGGHERQRAGAQFYHAALPCSRKEISSRPITTPARPCGSCRLWGSPIISRAKSISIEATGTRRRLPIARRPS